MPLVQTVKNYEQISQPCGECPVPFFNWHLCYFISKICITLLFLMLVIFVLFVWCVSSLWPFIANKLIDWLNWEQTGAKSACCADNHWRWRSTCFDRRPIRAPARAVVTSSSSSVTSEMTRVTCQQVGPPTFEPWLRTCSATSDGSHVALSQHLLRFLL